MHEEDVLAKKVLVSAYQEGGLEWSKVGVFVMAGFAEEERVILRKDIEGKAILCESLIMSIPYETLMENK